MSIRIKRGDQWYSAESYMGTDTSLTYQGYPADAKAVGERLKQFEEDFEIFKRSAPGMSTIEALIEEKIAKSNPLAMSISGTLSINNGGTGSTTKEDALKNLGGISFTELWSIEQDVDYKEGEVFTKRHYSNLPWIGDVDSYPYLIVVTSETSMLIPHRQGSYFLSFSDMNESSKKTYAYSRQVSINFETKNLYFGDNGIVGLARNSTPNLEPNTFPFPNAYILNARNVPLRVIGISNVMSLNGELHKIAVQSY